MRLWSIHPQFLDRQGLLATWREGLLAQSVIIKLKNGKEPGYKNHPQLQRFLRSQAPLLLINTWLTSIYEEAEYRGYKFNYDKILMPNKYIRLTVTDGQLNFEYEHILGKLKDRSPDLYDVFRDVSPKPHPMFIVVPGEKAAWEKG